MRRSTQHAERERPAILGGLFVLHVQHGRHLVAVLGFKTAGGEDHVASKVGVHEAHALLLRVAHEEGAVYLDVVDEDEVLVVVAAAHIVLGTQLVDGGRTRQHLDDGFHATARRGHLEGQFRIDPDVAVFALALYVDLFQPVADGGQHHGDVPRLFGLHSQRHHGVLVADLLEIQPEIHILRHVDGELPKVTGDSLEIVVQHLDDHILDRLSLFV